MTAKKNPLSFSILGQGNSTRTLQSSTILREKNHKKLRKISKNHLKKKKKIKKKKIRRTQIDHTSPVHPVSESSGGYRKRYGQRTNERKSSCLILDCIIPLKITAILLNGWILPIGEVALGRVSTQPAKQACYI